MNWKNRFKKPVYNKEREISRILASDNPTPEEQQKVLEWFRNKNLEAFNKALDKVASQIDEKVE